MKPVALLLTLVFGTASTALAQQQFSRCTDVVRFANGGFVRGTIVENIPGDHVTLQLLTGEAKSYPAAEVAQIEACGTNAPAPAPASAPQPPAADETKPRELILVHAQAARLSIESNRPGIELMLETKQATDDNNLITVRGYDRICVAPCEASLPVGTYKLAFSEDNDLYKVDDAVSIPGSGRLVAQLEDDSDMRTAGYITLGVGGAVGLGLTVAGFASGAATEGEGFPIWSAVIGTVISVASAVTGGILASDDDDATVTFIPAH